MGERRMFMKKNIRRAYIEFTAYGVFHIMSIIPESELNFIRIPKYSNQILYIELNNTFYKILPDKSKDHEKLWNMAMQYEMQHSWNKYNNQNDYRTNYEWATAYNSRVK
jgi:hypothetical protein